MDDNEIVQQQESAPWLQAAEQQDDNEIVQQQESAPWLQAAEQQQQQQQAPITQHQEGKQAAAQEGKQAEGEPQPRLLPDGRPDQNDGPGYCKQCGFSLYHYAGKPCQKAGEPDHPAWYSPDPPSFADVNR